MKNTKPFLLSAIIVALFAITMIGGCQHDNNNTLEPDWATPLIGTYQNTDPYQYASYTFAQTTSFTVTRTGNKTIHLQIDRVATSGFVPTVHSCFDSITLSSATAFSILEYDSCAAATFSHSASAFGTGSFTPNSLTINWSDVFSPPGSFGVDTMHFSMIAVK